MAVTDHYDFWNLDPAEAMSDFPTTWNWNIDKIDTAIHDAATAPVSLSRLPNLPASKTTTGTFSTARIPNLPAAQTTSGEFADARMPSTIARTSTTTALENRIQELENSNRDTGSRNMNSINPVISDGTFILMRIGSTVQLNLISLRFDSATGGSTDLDSKLPVGFRPTNTSNFNSLESVRNILVAYNGTIRVYGVNSSETISAVITFLTRDPWPSTLPGDPQ